MTLGITPALLALWILALAVHPAFAGPGSGPLADAAVRCRPWDGSASGEAALHTPVLPLGPLALALVGNAAGSTTGRGGQRYRLWSEACLEIGGEARGLRLGVASERRERADPGAASAILDGAAWRTIGALTLSGGLLVHGTRIPRAPLWITSWPPPLSGNWPDSFQPYSDQLPFFMTRSPLRVTLSVMDAGAAWSRGRWDLAVTGGLAVGQGVRTTRLARAEMAFRLVPGLALTARAASGVPRWLSYDLDERPYLSLGLRARAARFTNGNGHRDAGSRLSGPAWRMRSIGGGSYGVGVYAPAASRIELRGDFTGWEPITLSPTPDGWWEAGLQISRGVHQVEIRVDRGRWESPSGLPAGTGPYGGTVGMVVIE